MSQKSIKDYGISEILTEDPITLANLFVEEYSFRIPETLDTIEDLKTAERLLGTLTNTYSYLAQLLAYAKINVRTVKRDKGAKSEEAGDAIDRRDLIEAFVNTVELQYKAVSRMLTVKQQINEELHMSDM